MITKQEYQSISKEYGYVCSWAVWEKAGEKPKSNIANMHVFDLDKNLNLLETLRTDVIMVALNFARHVAFEKPFMNFHDANPHAQDFKIRYAFEETAFYGAYMTDIIKDFPMLSSKDVLSHLKTNPNVVTTQLERFRKEMKFIGAEAPVVLAFGKDTFGILKNGLDAKEYSSLIQLTHYSHHISKENYRKKIHMQLGIDIHNI